MKIRIAVAGLALAASTVSVGALAVQSAQADTNGSSGGTTQCAMESDGKTVYVPVGTRVGIIVCGSDGEWHVSATSVGPTTTTTTRPAAAGTISVTPTSKR
jgi:hypothetical protein